MTRTDDALPRPLSDERILITGGSGFIGTHLVDLLLNLGAFVTNLDVVPPNRPEHAPQWVRCDILKADILEALFQQIRPTVVLHLAARTDTEGTRLEDYAVNTEGTRNVVAASEMVRPRRLIHISSQYVHVATEPPTSDRDFRPHTVYGESKRISEEIVRSSSLDWVILRPTNVWGPYHPRYAREFWSVLDRGLYLHPGYRPIVRTYGYVGNVVHQMASAIELSDEAVSRHVFYLGDAPADIYRWADAFSLELTGKHARRVPRAVLATMAIAGEALRRFKVLTPIYWSRYRSMTTDYPSPIEESLGTLGSGPFSLEEGVAHSVKWYRSRPESG